jgi:hypothetical protein
VPYVILTPDGEPLADVEGRVFTFESIASALPFLLPGEEIECWHEWMENRQTGRDCEESADR